MIGSDISLSFGACKLYHALLKIVLRRTIVIKWSDLLLCLARQLVSNQNAASSSEILDQIVSDLISKINVMKEITFSDLMSQLDSTDSFSCWWRLFQNIKVHVCILFYVFYMESCRTVTIVLNLSSMSVKSRQYSLLMTGVTRNGSIL